MSADPGVLESLLSPPYDLSSFHIYGTIFDGATFERGLDPQKILVFELWRAECSKKEKIVFLGGVFRRALNIFLNWYILITNRLILDR